MASRSRIALQARRRPASTTAGPWKRLGAVTTPLTAGTSNLWDVDLAFTNLATSATISNTFEDIALAVATSDVFTEVTPKGQGGGSVYVDNIQVVPEPTTGLLLTLGLAGLGMRRRVR